MGQAGLLAQKDPWTPFWVVLVETAVKVGGNTALVAACGLGLTGAAAATTAAYWVGLVSVLSALRRTKARGADDCACISACLAS
jgi:Na+-driven multidrug efflux pump